MENHPWGFVFDDCSATCEFQYVELAEIMDRMELWAHRLCPSMTFDDFLVKTEQVGRKRPIKTYMKKLRMGMPLDDGDFETPNEKVEVEKVDQEPAKKKKKSTKEYVPIHVC